MRIKRLLWAAVGIIAFAVVGLPLALWVAFPAIAPLLAAPLLEARGIELIRLETTRPQLRGLTVNTLELADAAAGLGLRGDDIHIRWEHPLRAVEDGLASVVIRRLALTLDPPLAAPGTGASSAASPAAITLPTALLAGLPTRHLEITEFRARGRIAEQAFEAEGSLRASPSDANFAGILRSDALPAPMAIRAEVLADDQVSVRVDAIHESGPFLAVDGALSQAPAGPAFSGSARLDLDRIQSWLEAPTSWPTGTLDLHLAVALDPEPTLTLAPTSTGRVQLRHEDMTIAVVLALTESLSLTFTDDRLFFAAGTLPLQIDARRDASGESQEVRGTFDLAGFEIDAERNAEARLAGEGQVSWPDGSSAFRVDLPLRAEMTPLRLWVENDAELVLQDLEHQQTGLAHLRVRTTAPLSSSAEGLLEAAALALLVDDPGRLELTANLRVTPTGDIDAEIAEASLPLSGNDLLAMVLPATVAPRSGRVSFDGRLQRSAAGIIEAALQARWRNAGLDLTAARVRGASGDAAFTVAFDGGMLEIGIANATATFERLESISAEGPRATILLEDLRASGEGGIGLDFTTGLELGEVAMSAAIAAGRLVRGENVAEEIEIDAQISGEAGLPQLEGRLRVASAAVGVPVKDLLCGFDTVDLRAWQLSDCSAAMLGGEIRLPQGDFDLDTGSGYLPLAVTGMQLGAVLGLMQDPALDGTGTLDGSLPLRLLGMRPIVEQGWLVVRPPGGVLAYVTAANVLAGIEQPTLRLTLRAVRDLRYQRLESRVDYTEEGRLTLTVDLLGSNPEIEGGRPIQLNLNVTQNLLELLQSLRLSDNIEQELQRRMQRVQP